MFPLRRGELLAESLHASPVINNVKPYNMSNEILFQSPFMTFYVTNCLAHEQK